MLSLWVANVNIWAVFDVLQYILWKVIIDYELQVESCKLQNVTVNWQLQTTTQWL